MYDKKKDYSTLEQSFDTKNNLIKLENSVDGVFMYLEINLDTPSPKAKIVSMFNDLLELTLDAKELDK